MPSPDHHIPENRGIDWPAVVRTLLVQILVLVALAVGFVAYVNWSSERALSEFVRASEMSLLAPYRQPQARTSIQAVKGEAACRRRETRS